MIPNIILKMSQTTVIACGDSASIKCVRVRYISVLQRKMNDGTLYNTGALARNFTSSRYKDLNFNDIIQQIEAELDIVITIDKFLAIMQDIHIGRGSEFFLNFIQRDDIGIFDKSKGGLLQEYKRNFNYVFDTNIQHQIFDKQQVIPDSSNNPQLNIAEDTPSPDLTPPPQPRDIHLFDDNSYFDGNGQIRPWYLFLGLLIITFISIIFIGIADYLIEPPNKASKVLPSTPKPVSEVLPSSPKVKTPSPDHLMEPYIYKAYKMLVSNLSTISIVITLAISFYYVIRYYRKKT